jgi:hypothetical protein
MVNVLVSQMTKRFGNVFQFKGLLDWQQLLGSVVLGMGLTANRKNIFKTFTQPSQRQTAYGDLIR